MYDYFSVEETCAAEEALPVVFAAASFRLGAELPTARTTSGERSDEVRAGTVATVPLWAAKALRETGGYVSVLAPATYRAATFREFKADPMAPNLRAKSPYFYDVGLALCSLMGVHEAGRLSAQIIRLFQLRYMKIIRAAAKRGLDFNDVYDTLSERERDLVDAVRDDLLAELQWRSSAI